MTDKKYTRILRKLCPVVSENNNYLIVWRLMNLNSPETLSVNGVNANRSTYLRIQFLEFIRYNIERIEFELL